MQIATKTAHISILPNKILVVKFIDNNEDIDLNEAKAQIAAADQLSNGQPMLVLVDARNSVHELTHEAKDHIANFGNKIAEAFLVKELHQRIIAAFYLRQSTSKHDHPVKVFNDETAAIAWLLSFKK